MRAAPGAVGRYRLGLGDPGRGSLPLLLLPGIEGDARAWSRLEALGADRVAEAWDLPGGASVPELAAALLADCPWPRLHLVGASLGGLVAWEASLQAPGRIASLCTLGSLPSPRFRPRRIATAAVALRRLPPGLVRRRYRARIRARHDEEGVPAELSALLLAALPAPEVLADRLQAVARWNPVGPPPVPTLWLRGQVDHEAPWTVAEASVALPAAAVETVPGGHRAMLTHPQALAAVIRHFLSAQEQPLRAQ